MLIRILSYYILYFLCFFWPHKCSNCYSLMLICTCVSTDIWMAFLNSIQIQDNCVLVIVPLKQFWMHRYFMCYWSFDIFLKYKYVQIPEKIGWMFPYSTDCFTCFYLITIACTMWLDFNLFDSTDTYIHVGTCKSHLINYNWFLTFYVLLKNNLEK